MTEAERSLARTELEADLRNWCDQLTDAQIFRRIQVLRAILLERQQVLATTKYLAKRSSHPGGAT